MRIVVLFAVVGLALTAEWGYESHDENMWKADFPGCGGDRQSPIDIPHSDSDHLQYENLGEITFTGYDRVYGNVEILNNGHTATVNMPADQVDTTIQGGGLDGKYRALQFHFHWGPDDHSGSEHTFRGKMFPLELHIVHWKESYGSLAAALGNPDGAAVVGVFFEISEEDNPMLDPIINQLSSIRYKDENAVVSLSLTSILGSKTDEFYRYEGSLTTPGCNEVVIWTVMEGKNHISSRQLAKFRTLKETVQSSDHEMLLTKNYRPVQPLNTRMVTKNYAGMTPPSYHWGYEHGAEGPENWQYYYPTCSGLRQSPINIPALYDEKIVTKQDLETLEFINYDKMITGEIENNGHSVAVNIMNPDIYIQKGGLDGKYRAIQFHYHWGPSNKHGSEHTVNGMEFPLEMHIIHYKTSYGTVTEALKRDDGLAVVGFLFQVADSTNTAYTNIIDELSSVKFKGQKKANIGGFSLEHLTLNNLKRNSSAGIHYPFYRYEGGLTTPPCSQVVIWTVINEPVHISSAQLEHFRELAHIPETSSPLDEHDLILENYRPVQELFSRHVFISSPGLVGQPGLSTPVGFEWSYHGDSGAHHWDSYYPTCAGERQSPIDIPALSSDDMVFDATMGLDSLEFINYDMPITGTIKNNGHTVQVDLENPSMYIQKGGLNGRYKAVQFHFHWGPDNMHGSEHLVDGKAFPLELHVVHYKESYGSVSAALKQEDGLAVVGFFFQPSMFLNSGISNILSSMVDVKYKGAAKAISGFNMEDVTVKHLSSNASMNYNHPYYRYMGGLTTPPCSQIVTWSVMRQTIPISGAQLAEFRKLLHVTEGESHSGDDQVIVENFRPVQALHSRKVYISHMPDPNTSSAPTLFSSLLCLTLAAVFIAMLR